MTTPKLQRLRWEAFKRQNHKCYWCGHPIKLGNVRPAEMLTGEHLKPISEGGKTVAENIVAAHMWCNGSRAAYPYEEAAMLHGYKKVLKFCVIIGYDEFGDIVDEIKCRVKIGNNMHLAPKTAKKHLKRQGAIVFKRRNVFE